MPASMPTVGAQEGGSGLCNVSRNGGGPHTACLISCLVADGFPFIDNINRLTGP